MGGWLHSWGFTPAAAASATMYQAVKVVPKMAMKVVDNPTLQCKTLCLGILAECDIIIQVHQEKLAYDIPRTSFITD